MLLRWLQETLPTSAVYISILCLHLSAVWIGMSTGGKVYCGFRAKEQPLSSMTKAKFMEKHNGNYSWLFKSYHGELVGGIAVPLR